MKKELKIIMKLTKKVGASLALLKNGTKRSVVLIAADKIGLIAVLGSKISSDPLNLGLNFHSFLIDKKLTSGNKGSLPFPKMGTKNLLVIGEVQSTGLSTVLDSKVSSDPLKKGLNFLSFLGELL